MITIEKFNNKFKSLENNVFISFNYEPEDKEIIEEVTRYGNGLYILKTKEEYSYIAFYNGHWGEFSNKQNAIKLLKYMIKIYER